MWCIVMCVTLDLQSYVHMIALPLPFKSKKNNATVRYEWVRDVTKRVLHSKRSNFYFNRTLLKI